MSKKIESMNYTSSYSDSVLDNYKDIEDNVWLDNPIPGINQKKIDWNISVDDSSYFNW